MIIVEDVNPEVGLKISGLIKTSTPPFCGTQALYYPSSRPSRSSKDPDIYIIDDLSEVDKDQHSV